MLKSKGKYEKRDRISVCKRLLVLARERILLQYSLIRVMKKIYKGCHGSSQEGCLIHMGLGTGLVGIAFLEMI